MEIMQDALQVGITTIIHTLFTDYLTNRSPLLPSRPSQASHIQLCHVLSQFLSSFRNDGVTWQHCPYSQMYLIPLCQVLIGMVRFSLVQFFKGFWRTQNQAIGSVQNSQVPVLKQSELQTGLLPHDNIIGKLQQAFEVGLNLSATIQHTGS
jgi:hypothetical protein